MWRKGAVKVAIHFIKTFSWEGNFNGCIMFYSLKLLLTKHFLCWTIMVFFGFAIMNNAAMNINICLHFILL